MRVLAAGMVILVLGGCKPETVAVTTVSLGPLKVDPAAAMGDRVDRELWIYGGPTTTAMRLQLDVANLPVGNDNASVLISTGGGTEVQRVTANGPVTSAVVSGNVARVRVVAAARAVIPDIRINSLALTRSSAIVGPEDVVELADRVSTVPLLPGQTVDFPLPEGRTRYFFSFQAAHEGDYDFAYFGRGRLLIQGANDPDYPVAATADYDTVPLSGSTVPFTRIRMRTGEVRRMAVEGPGAGESGGGRVVVMERGGMQRLAFPSQAPQHFSLTALGVDHQNPPGTRGPFEGVLDCTNYAGATGIVPDLTPGTFRPVAGLPPCYRGHEGTDWPLALGPGGQAVQASTNAAAPGVVLAVDASHYDECLIDPFSNFTPRCPNGFFTMAPPVDNFIAIRQDDGLIAYYVHGGTGASLVVPGQRVACGELLTVVGSAGSSAGPHLHFELREVSEAIFRTRTAFTRMALILPPGDPGTSIRSRSKKVDPFGPNSLWRSLGPNQAPEPRCR